MLNCGVTITLPPTFITFYSIKCTLLFNGMFGGKIYFNEDQIVYTTQEGQGLVRSHS